MTITVALSIGEKYPHLFASTEASDIDWARNPASDGRDVVIELTDEQWADYQQAADRYYVWIGRLEDMRRAAGGKMTS